MRFKSDKGITLTLLVITVLLMMILTGITISFIANDDGMIERAHIEKNITEKMQADTEQEIQEMYTQLQNNQ